MNTLKHLLTITGCLIAQFVLAQNYIPYYPGNWEFKKEVDLVDFSQVKALTSKYFTIDGKKEYPVYENYFSWNSTYQLTDYELVNFNNNNANFTVCISYANPGGNQLKSVRILHPKTGKPLEEWEYTNGSFDVAKITVKRHLLNVAQPDLFEVKYEGNDDDFIQETVFSPQKTIDRQTKQWYIRKQDGTYQSIHKHYLGKNLVFDQTDSVLLNQHQKKIIHYTINDGLSNYMRYKYKSRKVEVSGELMEYKQLESLVKDGKDFERYEYEYDDRGNWTVCKIYRVKYARWEYAHIIRRQIEYRN